MKKFLVVAVFCFSIILAGEALATDVAGGPYQGTVVNGYIDFDLGTVIWDPEAPPIIKIINTDGTAQTVTLVENIHVGGPIPWTDWDEQLMVSDGAGGWVYSPDDDELEWVAPVTVAGLPAGTTCDWNDNEPIDLLVINFNPPLPISTQLTITKTIFVPEGMNQFAVFEWPTVPEPSIALMALGLLALRFRKK